MTSGRDEPCPTVKGADNGEDTTENHPDAVVRHASGRGCKLLLFNFPELESYCHQPLWRHRPGGERLSDGCRVRTRWPEIHRAQWWAALQIHRSDFAGRELRGSGRGGLLLGEIKR